jgi:hypothetical protein
LFGVLPLIATLVLSSCGGSEPAASGGAVIDTLANGAVRVVNTAEGIWGLDETQRWVVSEDLRIGVLDGEAPYVFGLVRNVFPGTQGRIWVMDSQAFELRLFNSDGSFERAVGKRGEGPGEFAGNPCAFPGPNGEAWVEDTLRRWQGFVEDGRLVGNHRVTSNLGCGIRRWTPDGRFFVVNTSRAPGAGIFESTSFFVVHRMGTEGEFEGELIQGDTVFAPIVPPSPRVTWVSANSRGRIISTVPFTPRATWVLGPSGDFWVTDGGGSYAIRRQSPVGDTLLMIERSHVPVPIPNSIRAQEIEDFRPEGRTAEGGFDSDQVARVYPPFDSFTIGTDGTLWVRKQVGDGAIGLDVFSSDGIYLGAAVVPPDFAQMRISYAGPDWLYGIVRDDLDVQYVVRLEIQRPGP